MHNWVFNVYVRPFSVSPENGDLAVGACMQVTVDYLSAQVGDHSSEMVLHYDTGWYSWVCVDSVNYTVFPMTMALTKFCCKKVVDSTESYTSILLGEITHTITGWLFLDSHFGVDCDLNNLGLMSNYYRTL